MIPGQEKNNGPPPDTQLIIDAPRTDQELAQVKALFEQYMRSLEIDLAFQNADAELADFPNRYRAVLQARSAVEILGAVALKSLDDRRCEMKRLYCLPQSRGLGVGRRLAQAIILVAQKLGYRSMRLDTFRSMESAVALYKSLGFVEIPAYYHNPYPNVLYFEKDLLKHEQLPR